MISLPSLYSPGNIDKLLWGAAYLVGNAGYRRGVWRSSYGQPRQGVDVKDDAVGKTSGLTPVRSSTPRVGLGATELRSDGLRQASADLPAKSTMPSDHHIPYCHLTRHLRDADGVCKSGKARLAGRTVVRLARQDRRWRLTCLDEFAQLPSRDISEYAAELCRISAVCRAGSSDQSAE